MLNSFATEFFVDIRKKEKTKKRLIWKPVLRGFPFPFLKVASPLHPDVDAHLLHVHGRDDGPFLLRVDKGNLNST